MATSCFDAISLYVSYEALFISNSRRFRPDVNAHLKVPMDQILTLDLVLLFFLMARAHEFLFFHTLLLLPVGSSILVAPRVVNEYRNTIKWLGLKPSWIAWNTMFSFVGQLLFLVMVLLHVIVAHSEEQASRLRFKLKHATELTSMRTQGILDTLMPPLVLKDLQGPDLVTSHKYRHATVVQSDLCGFTKLASTVSPKQVVKFMSELFGDFDQLTDKHQVYKVETIGDAYIAGVAESPLTAENSPINVVLFGLAMVQSVAEWAKKQNIDQGITCRVGVHHGECIGGVVGTCMQRYHLFGDLLVGLEILESTAPEGQVQMSEACKVEIERQLREVAAERSGDGIEWNDVLHWWPRNVMELKTSKGEVHSLNEVGGKTYIVQLRDEIDELCNNS